MSELLHTEFLSSFYLGWCFGQNVLQLHDFLHKSMEVIASWTSWNCKHYVGQVVFMRDSIWSSLCWQLMYGNSNFNPTIWTKLSKKYILYHTVQKLMDLLRLRSGHWTINPWGMTSNCTSCIIPCVWKRKEENITFIYSNMFNSKVHKGTHNRTESSKSLTKIFFNTFFFYFKPKGKTYIRKNRWLPMDSLIDNIFKTSKIKYQDIIKKRCFEKLSVISHWSKAWKWPLKINLKITSGFTNSETDTNFKLQSSKE